MAGQAQTRVNLTDRAKRYRAQNAVTGEHVCVLCGSTDNLGVMHLDGNEDHGEPANLAWGCKSCNAVLAAAFKRIGAGKPTNQYNPARLDWTPVRFGTGSEEYHRAVRWRQDAIAKGYKVTPVKKESTGRWWFKYAPPPAQMSLWNPSTGVPSFAQYAWAVSNHSRGAHDEGGAIIHATPKHKRIEYARRIAESAGRTKRAKADERWNVAKKSAFEKCVESVTKGGSAADPRAVCAVAGRRKYGQAEMTRRAVAGKKRAARNPSEAYEAGKRALLSAADQHGTPNLTPSIAQRDDWRGSWGEFMRGWNAGKKAWRPNPAKFDRCVKDVKAKGGDVNAYAVCTAAGTRNPARYSVKITSRSPRGSVASIFRDGVFLEDVGPVTGDWQRYNAKANDKAARSAAADRVFDFKVLDWGRAGNKGLYPGRPPRRGRRNPAGQAAEVFEEFHGYGPDELVVVEKQVHHHEHLASAGALVGLQVKPIGHGLPLREIEGLGDALLTFNEKKNQLFITGGDQSLSWKELQRFGIETEHELQTIGKLVGVGYETDKTHLGDEGGHAIYSHTFRTTNENGVHIVVRIAKYPDLIYRVLDEQFEISGGDYEIRREGIDK